MAMVEELKAAVDRAMADKAAIDAEMQSVAEKIEDMKEHKLELMRASNDARYAVQDAQRAYDKARPLTDDEAAFLTKAAMVGGYEYQHSTGGGFDRTYATTAEGEMSIRLRASGFISVGGFGVNPTAHTTKEGRAKLAEYESSEAKPRKKASK